MEKRYGLPTAISMVIGIVIGSGVFIKGGKVLALTSGNMLQGVLVVAIVGLICIICSLVFAELGSKFEKVTASSTTPRSRWVRTTPTMSDGS